MAPHSSTLAWKIPWTEEPGRLQSMGSQRVGHDWATSLSLFHFHALEKEMATRSSVLAWRIPGTGEPGGLPSVGSHRVGHDWSDLAAAYDISSFLKNPFSIELMLLFCPKSVDPIFVGRFLNFILACWSLSAFFFTTIRITYMSLSNIRASSQHSLDTPLPTVEI